MIEQPNEITCIEKEHEIYYAYDDECVAEMEVSMTIFVNTLPYNVYEGILRMIIGIRCNCQRYVDVRII